MWSGGDLARIRKDRGQESGCQRELSSSASRGRDGTKANESGRTNSGSVSQKELTIPSAAAFPANLLFPLAVIFIAKYNLNPNIWLSPLMILGTQWYILFNVIAGTSAFSNDLVYASDMLHIKGRLWWQKVILPGIFPYLVTGCITAAGGAWNASIIAEIVSWGNTQFVAEGIGAYITQATLVNNFPKIIIGIGISLMKR